MTLLLKVTMRVLENSTQLSHNINHTTTHCAPQQDVHSSRMCFLSKHISKSQSLWRYGDFKAADVTAQNGNTFSEPFFG